MTAGPWQNRIIRGRKGTLTILCAVAPSCLALTGWSIRATQEPPDPRYTAVQRLANVYVMLRAKASPQRAELNGDVANGNGHFQIATPDGVGRTLSQERELLRRLTTIVPRADTVTVEPLQIATTLLQEAINTDLELSVCHFELWSLVKAGVIMQLWPLEQRQPVGDPRKRAAALERWGVEVPHALDQQVSVFRRGIAVGYVDTESATRQAMAYIDKLLPDAGGDTPLDAPALRDSDPEFRSRFRNVVRVALIPALQRYRTFLEREYLPHARASMALSELPHGRQCYEAVVHNYSGTSLTGSELRRLGTRALEAVEERMRDVARKAYGTEDVDSAMAFALPAARRFQGGAEEVRTVRSTIERAHQVGAQQFALFPSTPVAVRIMPHWGDGTSIATYARSGTSDPDSGVMLVDTTLAREYAPETIAPIVYHEAGLGHYVMIELSRQALDTSPLGVFVPGVMALSEGWAMYAEGLASAFGMATTPPAQLALLNSERWRAARLLTDQGLHEGGWSAEEGRRFLMSHGIQQGVAAAEVVRYLMIPGQGTSYTIGLELLRDLRAKCVATAGDRCTERAFDEQVLRAGVISPAVTTARVMRWAKHPT